MIFFTSDLHFYHEKIAYDDEVYILGDFTMKGADYASTILYSLKGKKHLIRGNHDQFVDKTKFDKSLFVSVRDYLEIKYLNTHFILFHYPILEWNGTRKGNIALHGHQHNHKDYNIQNRKKGILRYDVGVDANDMAPVSAKEIIEFFS